jgi:uncharacterized tellurite resistance protein B-like protein
MLDALKTFLTEISGQEPQRRRDASDHQLAAAALLVHLAAIDGEFDAVEQRRLRDIVETRFGLDGGAARRLIQDAWENEREAVDLYRFTSVLKRSLDENGRRAVIEMLWEMAYADGAVHEFEENVVWRVAELLGVSARERVELRQTAKEAGEPPPPGPWSQKRSDT